MQKSKGRKTIRLGGRREWVGGSVIKWSKSLRRGGPIQIGLWTRVEEGKAVCKCSLGCMCQSSRPSGYVRLSCCPPEVCRCCATACLCEPCASSRMKEDASSLNRPPTSNATTTNLHLPPRRGSGRFALWLFWRLPKLLRCMFRAAVVAALRWCWVTPA